MANLREKYNTELRPAVLKEKLGIKNIMAVPKVNKSCYQYGCW